MVNFYFLGSFGFTEVFKTKDVLLETLKLRNYDTDKIRFEKSLFQDDDREIYVRYYSLTDDRNLVGELQYIKE